jgi:ACDE family multidrug resistance protein
LFGLLSFISDELETKHHITGILSGLLIAVPVTTMSITTFLTGSILQNKKRLLKPILAGGLGLTILGFISLVFFQALIPLIITVSIMGLGIGTILPALNIIITGACKMDERGLVTAIYGTVRFFGVALGPLAFSLALSLGRIPMFIGGAVVAGIALTTVMLVLNPQNILENNDLN